MKSFFRANRWSALVLLALTVVLVGCAPDASAHIVSPDLGEKLFAEEAGQEIVIAPTPEPVLLAELTTEEIYAGLPPEVMEAIASADATRGEQVALGNGCFGCHNVDPTVQMTGPTWHNIGDTAANRRPDTSPALYLYTSIVSPSQYVVPGFQDAMPKNFADLLSDQDIADLLAFLLAHNGQE